ncbi:MAG: hypothetical protein LC101_08560 [Flavobacteriales bacterium]|nr:hypothetical protein [Flavobacteriales bacterium]
MNEEEVKASFKAVVSKIAEKYPAMDYEVFDDLLEIGTREIEIHYKYRSYEDRELIKSSILWTLDMFNDKYYHVFGKIKRDAQWELNKWVEELSNDIPF